MPKARLTIPLEPVDSLSVTTLVDNVFDVFMPDQGPAHRLSPSTGGKTQPSATMVDGRAPDQPIAEHGLSLLVTITNRTPATRCSSTPAMQRRSAPKQNDKVVMATLNGSSTATAAFAMSGNDFGPRGPWDH